MPFIYDDIIEDTTWTAGESPYYICSYEPGKIPTIRPGATLTIEQGVTVYLGNSTIPGCTLPLSPSFVIEGSIKAFSTVFTGYPHGAPWGSIIFRSYSIGSFNDCSFSFGGYSQSSQSEIPSGMLLAETYSIATDISISGGTIYGSSSVGICIPLPNGGRLTASSVDFHNLIAGIYIGIANSIPYVANVNDCSICDCYLGAYCSNVSNLNMSGCTISNNSENGLYLESPSSSGYSHATIDRCDFLNNRVGVYVSASNIIFRNCLIAKGLKDGIFLANSVCRMESCTVAYNMTEGIRYIGYQLFLHNSIIYGNGLSDIDIQEGHPVDASYCLIGGPTVFPGIGNINLDPLFADVDDNDFHEKSIFGRWNPVTNSWVNDTVSSPCIDAGDPGYEYLNEPQPNGRIVNMGCYGNTPYASKSSAPPEYLGVEVDSSLRSVRMQFNERIESNAETYDELKASISIATDGANFTPLSLEANISILEHNLIVNLIAPVYGNATKFRIAANALKNKIGKSKDTLSETEPIAVEAPLQHYTARRVIPPTAEVVSIASVNNEFCVTRSDRVIMFSRNGIQWEACAPLSESIREVAYGNGKYVAAGVKGAIYKSEDKKRWEKVPSNTDSDLRSVTHADGQFTAVGNNGTIIKSDTGDEWTVAASPTTSRLNRVIPAAAAAMAAVGDNGTILRKASKEAVWQVEPAPSAANLRDIAASPGRLAAVSDEGAVVTRDEFSSWVAAQIATEPLKAVAYGNGKFMAAGSAYEAAAAAAASPAAWTAVPALAAVTPLAAAFAGNTFLLGGTGGILLQSGPLFQQQALARGVPF